MGLRGVTIQLLVKEQTGTDPLGIPQYAYKAKDVGNVLIAPLSGEEVLETINLTGRQATYQLAIPKGDTNVWEDQYVQFFGQTWRVIGKPIQGIDSLIPLAWNLKVRVESLYGQEIPVVS